MWAARTQSISHEKGWVLTRPPCTLITWRCDRSQTHRTRSGLIAFTGHVRERQRCADRRQAREVGGECWRVQGSSGGKLTVGKAVHTCDDIKQC